MKSELLLNCKYRKSHNTDVPLLTLVSFLIIWSSMVTKSAASDSDQSTSQSSGIIYPSKIKLFNKGDSARVLLQHIDDIKVVGGVIDADVEWFSDDAQIAHVVDRKVIAVNDGQTQIGARWTDETGRSQTAKIVVDVQQSKLEKQFEFNNHVQAVLAKASCNMGACHGALAGKGGFRLSLRGYDPIADHFAITREDRSRRVDQIMPARSLLLLKPSSMVAHKGGLRLPTDSEGYRVIADWIRQGAAGEEMEQPTLLNLHVYPPDVRLAIGDKQPISVVAEYSNGRFEDVTDWAKFSSTDESVATVGENGVAEMIGNGQSSISVWFSSRIQNARISVPFSDGIPSDAFDNLVKANAIDEAVVRKLTQLNLAPSKRCTDSEFIRRVYLDTIGLLPTSEEVTQFVNATAPGKRNMLIEHLLNRPEYVDYWTYRWCDLFMLNGAILQVDGVKAYYQWIHDHVEKDTPWDQFATEILTATGDAFENGATNFYALNQDPEGMTENACQAFLGLSIGCAKCHNHPLEKWTNDQYYAMANMFARVRAKGWAGETRNGDAKRTVLVLDRGDLIQPNKGKPQIPAPLDAEPLDIDDPSDRRIALAKWMTSPDNPYFTRAICNRVWHAFFGVGIVNSVDDMRESNPESNPELMAVLTNFLVENDYDLKSLIRFILQSETYQLSSQTNLNNAKDTLHFSHYYPRRLMAEVLHDCVVQVSKVDSAFTQVEFPGNDRRKVDFYPEGTRAIQLYDSAIENKFLRTFGRNQRRIVCECERSNEPSVVQVLNINNGETINEKLSASQSIVTQVIETYKSDYRSMVDSAYMRCLARQPTEHERDLLVAEIGQFDDEAGLRANVEDLYWSLMSSREFLFQH